MNTLKLQSLLSSRFRFLHTGKENNYTVGNCVIQFSATTNPCSGNRWSVILPSDNIRKKIQCSRNYFSKFTTATKILVIAKSLYRSGMTYPYLISIIRRIYTNVELLKIRFVFCISRVWNVYCVIQMLIERWI